MRKDSRRQRFNLHEMQMIRTAYYVRKTGLGGGNYLVSPGRAKVALRLIEEGYLTRADVTFSPPQDDWVVVRVEEPNRNRINTVLARMRAAARKTEKEMA